MIRERALDARYTAKWLEVHSFKIGDRVVFSHWADRNGVSLRRKGGVRSGVVEGIVNERVIKVRLDGYKHASEYHHMFFIPAREAGN